MCMLRSLIVASCFILWAGSAGAETRHVGRPEPQPEELLSAPIKLTECPGVTITEWRRSNEPFSGESDDAIRVLNKTCKKSVELFMPFLNSVGIDFKQKPLEENISLLPWNGWDNNHKHWGRGDGDDYRNLQDFVYRFDTRFVKNEQKSEVYGWTDRNINYVFVLNDVLDKEDYHPPFVEVMSHELFHAISNVSGLYNKIGGDRDEELAMDFGKFVYDKLED